jgi:hypothetical protein
LRSDDFLKWKKADLYIIAALLCFAAIAVLLVKGHKNGDYIIVESEEGKQQYSLNEDREIIIGSAEGGHNKIVISNGYVHMEEADCPNQLCVKHKPISLDGESIVCLPNNVYVTVVSKNKKETDN